jgi:hypothetical protein
MRSACLVLLVAVAAATASVTAYHIAPRTAALSGKVSGNPENGGVAQTVVCCWDSLERIELFAGTKGDTGSYTATVYDGNTQLMTSTGTQDWDCRWVRFENWDQQVAFTKGKTLTIKFTRSGGDLIEYYYQSGDPYRFGMLIDPGWQDPVPIGLDLACRVYGLLNPADSMVWGAYGGLPPNPWQRDSWVAYMSQVGAKWSTSYFCWDSCETLQGSFDFRTIDDFMTYVAKDAGMEPVGVLLTTPKWASTRIDTTLIDSLLPAYRVDTSVWAVPRGLWASGDSNLWARFVDRLVDHVDDSAYSIHTWSIWNEENEGATTWVYGNT